MTPSGGVARVVEVVEVSGKWGIVGGGWLLLAMTSKETAEEGATQLNKALAPLIAKAEAAEKLENELRESKEGNERLKMALDSVCHSDPCPKCGAGVSFECYGCKVKEIETRAEKMAEALEAIAKTEDCSLSPDGCNCNGCQIADGCPAGIAKAALALYE